MDVSENRGTPKSSILIGISIINHPFWGYPYFWKHPYLYFWLVLLDFFFRCLSLFCPLLPLRCQALCLTHRIHCLESIKRNIFWGTAQGFWGIHRLIYVYIYIHIYIYIYIYNFMSFCWIFNFVVFFLSFLARRKSSVVKTLDALLLVTWLCSRRCASLASISASTLERSESCRLRSKVCWVCLVSKWQLMGKCIVYENCLLIVYSYCLFKPKK